MIDHKLYYEDLEYCISYPLDWRKLENKTILIIGATGLIGQFMIDMLMLRNKTYSSNISIIAISRNSEIANNYFNDYLNNSAFNYISHDINKPLENINSVDYIIHAASNTHPIAYTTDPIGTITTNVLGTYNMLNYSKQNNNTRSMLLSTVEIYGENNIKKEKFSEDDCGYINCAELRAGYPESKRVSESLCYAFKEKYKMDIVIPRLCRIYGPTMTPSDSKVLSQFIKNAINNESIILKSNGNQLFSYCYVADAVTGILTILLNGKSGEVYNIADSNSDISLKELANLVALKAGTNVIFRIPEQLEYSGYSKATKAILDSSKLDALGWKTRDSISTGVEKTIDILKRK